jgi:hypothetical protein
MVRPPVYVSPHRACISILLVLVSAGLAFVGPAKALAEPPETVVAIGDVHGDFDDFVAILQRTGLIDKQNHWTGGKTTFVQVGDLLDRGPKPREVMDLMMALEKEAAQAGGRVVSLLGNHEMMNIMGDLRYVTPENYASFANANSEERRKSAYKDYVKWRESHTAFLAELPQPMELTEAEWMARHPPGFIEQREAFGPKGEYGVWLRGHAALAEIKGVIFLHGGISPGLASMKLNAINSGIRDEISAFDSCETVSCSTKRLDPAVLQSPGNHCGVLRRRSSRRSKSRDLGVKPRAPGEAPPVPCSSQIGSACASMGRCGSAVTTSGAKKRVQLAGRQAPAKLTKRITSWYGTHGAKRGTHPLSLRWQGLVDRHRYAEQLLPRGQGVGSRNPE